MKQITVQTPIDVKIYYTVRKTAPAASNEATERIFKHVKASQAIDALYRYGVLNRETNEPSEDWFRRNIEKQLEPDEDW